MHQWFQIRDTNHVPIRLPPVQGLRRVGVHRIQWWSLYHFYKFFGQLGMNVIQGCITFWQCMEQESHDNGEEHEGVRLLQGQILEVENPSISM